MLRAALFNEQGKEVSRWQGRGDQFQIRVTQPVCQDKSSPGQGLSDFIGLAPKPSFMAPPSRTVVEVEGIALAPASRAAPSSLDPEEVAGATNCSVEVTRQPKGTGLYAQLTSAQGAGVYLTAVPGYRHPNLGSYTLFDCDVAGFWALSSQGASRFDWDGRLQSESPISLPLLKRDKPYRIRKAGDNVFDYLQEGAEVGHRVLLKPVAPPAQAKTAVDEVQALERSGALKRLTVKDVESIQDEYRSSQRVSVRVADWFKSREKQVIKTDLPHAQQYWLITRQIPSLPRASYSGPHGTVYFVAKGVQAPSSGLRSARVLDLNTWQCIGETFWCPWPAPKQP